MDIMQKEPSIPAAQQCQLGLAVRLYRCLLSAGRTEEARALHARRQAHWATVDAALAAGAPRAVPAAPRQPGGADSLVWADAMAYFTALEQVQPAQLLAEGTDQLTALLQTPLTPSSHQHLIDLALCLYRTQLRQEHPEDAQALRTRLTAKLAPMGLTPDEEQAFSNAVTREFIEKLYKDFTDALAKGDLAAAGQVLDTINLVIPEYPQAATARQRYREALASRHQE